MSANVRWFSELGLADLEEVGGKNASLGEMVGNLASAGVRVPDGFATTATASALPRRQPGWRSGSPGCWRAWTPTTCDALAEVGKEIRAAVVEQPLPRRPRGGHPRRRTTQLVGGRRRGVASRCARQRDRRGPAGRVVRRAAGDLPQHPRHRRGPARRSGRCSPRSTTTGRSPTGCTTASSTPTSALSAGVQRMVRSDVGASGVMFTMDTESGFDDAVFITSSYGLGEAVVQGAVNPDEFYVYKPALRGRAGRRSSSAGVGGKATKMVYTDDADRRAGRPSSSTSTRPSGGCSASPTTRSRSWPGTR